MNELRSISPFPDLDTRTLSDVGQLKYLSGEIERLKKVFADATNNTERDISDTRLRVKEGERIDQPKFQNWVLDDFRQAVNARAKAIEYYYQLAHLRPDSCYSFRLVRLSGVLLPEFPNAIQSGGTY